MTPGVNTVVSTPGRITLRVMRRRGRRHAVWLSNHWTSCSSSTCPGLDRHWAQLTSLRTCAANAADPAIRSIAGLCSVTLQAAVLAPAVTGHCGLIGHSAVNKLTVRSPHTAFTQGSECSIAANTSGRLTCRPQLRQQQHRTGGAATKLSQLGRHSAVTRRRRLYRRVSRPLAERT